MRSPVPMLAIVLAAAAAASRAEVVQATASGALLRDEVSVTAPPSKVYNAVVGQVGSWWNPQHTFSGDAKNLSIEARPGGCFCERLPNGGGVEHLHVIFVSPNQLLRMSGALGPFQSSGIAGSMTWEFLAADGGTKVRLTYSLGGFMAGGFEKIAPVADSVLLDQLQRLKSFIETGDPAPKAPGK